MSNKLTIYKSNAVVHAAYQLTLNEQRVVLASIGLIDPRKELLDTDRFELSAKDFAVMFDVSEKNAYKALIEVTEKLFNRYVTIERPFPDKPHITRLKTRWISSICYMDTEGKVALRFAPDLIPYLSQLKGSFTRYELKHIGNMTSTYGIRIYELLMQWRTTGRYEIEIARLKQFFEIKDKYASIKDFKKYVIEPAVKDINTHSNFSVSWEQRKTGRAVTHLIFTFTEKQPEPAPATIDHVNIQSMLTDEQMKCWQWAKKVDFWKAKVSTEKSFLTNYNTKSGTLKAQYEVYAGVSQVAVSPEAVAAKAKNTRKVEITNLINEIANLENMNKLSPNASLAKQLADKQQQLEKFKKAK